MNWCLIDCNELAALSTAALAALALLTAVFAAFSYIVAKASYRAAHPPALIVRWVNFIKRRDGSVSLSIAITNEGAHPARVNLGVAPWPSVYNEVHGEIRWLIQDKGEALARVWPSNSNKCTIPASKQIVEAGEAWEWEIPPAELSPDMIEGRDLYIIGVIRYATAKKYSVFGSPFAPYRTTFGFKYIPESGRFQRIDDPFFNYPMNGITLA